MNNYNDFKKRMEIKNKLHDMFINSLIDKIITHFNHYGFEKINAIKLEQVTRMILDSMDFTERDFMLVLYGLIAPNASFNDFWFLVKNHIPEIKNFFDANHGIEFFEGKYCMTRDGEEILIIKYSPDKCECSSKGTVSKIIKTSDIIC